MFQLTLALFVFWVGANDKEAALAAYHLAALAHLFNGRTYFHGVITNIRIAANIRICIFVLDSYIRDDSSLQSVNYPPLGFIIGREFDPHPIARKHADVMQAHSAGEVCEDFLPII